MSEVQADAPAQIERVYRAKCSEVFRYLKDREAVAYAANRAADEAKAEWERACRDLALFKSPELGVLGDEVRRLRAELATAESKLDLAADKAELSSYSELRKAR